MKKIVFVTVILAMVLLSGPAVWAQQGDFFAIDDTAAGNPGLSYNPGHPPRICLSYSPQSHPPPG